MIKKHILDLPYNELEKEIEQLGFEKFRARQIWDWIYKKNVFSFEQMQNISSKTANILNQKFSTFIPKIENVAESKFDNSHKFVLCADDGKYIESMLMLDNGRATVCVSCMIGCPLGCSFCATGSEIGFIRKLNACEILGQIFAIQNYAKDKKIANKITNIVFMGMGEPFLNIVAVTGAINALVNPNGFGMSKFRITISTAGVAPTISEFINKFGIRLAISLHFPNDKLRSSYMPVNKSFSLLNLISELKKIKLLRREYITIEYIMLSGINDQIEHVKQLVSLLSCVKVKFNLIPYNSTKRLDLLPSPELQINKFAAYLRDKAFTVTVRRSRGVDITGGCGQFVLKKQASNF